MAVLHSNASHRNGQLVSTNHRAGENGRESDVSGIAEGLRTRAACAGRSAVKSREGSRNSVCLQLMTRVRPGRYEEVPLGGACSADRAKTGRSMAKVISWWSVGKLSLAEPDAAGVTARPFKRHLSV